MAKYRGLLYLDDLIHPCILIKHQVLDVELVLYTLFDKVELVLVVDAMMKLVFSTVFYE